MIIRKANSEEYKLLSNLAINSKSYWDYSEKFIQSCRNEFSYSVEDKKNPNNHFVVAELENRIVGFYELVLLESDKLELEALFVDPDFIGKGIGKALINNAKLKAFEKGVKSIIIQGDPNAEIFYLSIGCEKLEKKNL